MSSASKNCANPPKSTPAAQRSIRALGAADLIARMRRTWLGSIEKYLQNDGVTLAVVNMDLLLEPGGLLDELRAKGYEVDAP